MPRRLIGWITGIAAAAVLAAFLVRPPGGRGGGPGAGTAPPAELQAILWPAAREVAPFSMVTQRGAAFGAQDLRGTWSFVFFGYLGCPDVCPTTLQAMAAFRQRLLAGDAAARGYQFVFVSVDPAHDTAERMDGYLAYFDRDFIGLSGDSRELSGLARSLGAAYAERVDERGVRSIEHSTSIVVVDPAGRVVGALPAPHDPARMPETFEVLRRWLGG